jgi:ferredoxin
MGRGGMMRKNIPDNEKSEHLYLKTANLCLPDKEKLMNVTIDRMACVICGACWNTCPELFDQNHCDSFSEIVEDYRFNGDRAVGIVPDNFCCCAQAAADLCPVHIIRIC